MNTKKIPQQPQWSNPTKNKLEEIYRDIVEEYQLMPEPAAHLQVVFRLDNMTAAISKTNALLERIAIALEAMAG